MRTVDLVSINAPLEHVFRLASQVEDWPRFLPHYRWVKKIEDTADRHLVEMAAWRPFGLFKYPTWWVSEMTVAPSEWTVRYHHVEGITTGMDVEWRMISTDRSVDVVIIHEWDGPGWPMIGRAAADLVIGPVFIHGIASRTLEGVKREAERE